MSGVERIRVLLVEDDDEDAAIFSRYVGQMSCYAVTLVRADDEEQARSYLASERPDLIFLDLNLGGGPGGLDLLGRLHREGTDVPVSVVTGAGDELKAVEVRRYLMQKLEEEVKRLAHIRRPFSLLMIDLNHFKEVNDRYGHQAGDEVLRRCAVALQERVRGIDLVARYGVMSSVCCCRRRLRPGLAGWWNGSERRWEPFHLLRSPSASARPPGSRAVQPTTSFVGRTRRCTGPKEWAATG